MRDTMKPLTGHEKWAEVIALASPEVREAIGAALCTRGPRKGWALKTCPAMGTPGNAGWQAIMRVWNPYKVSMCAAFFGDTDLIGACTDFLRSIPAEVREAYSLDKDRAALNPVW